MSYVKTISERSPIFAAFFESANRALTLARTAGHVVVLEVVEDGVKKYTRSNSCFGDPPVTNPLEARNFALTAPWPEWDRRENKHQPDDEFNDVWSDCSSLYVKDQGGGKSSTRSDVPGQVVVFDTTGVEQARFAFPTRG